MSRQALLESISATIADYRAGEIAPRTPAVVDRWISQFDETVQIPLLQEINHVLKANYCSKAAFRGYFEYLTTEVKTCRFWKKAKFLNIQQRGNSQRELLAVFDEVLSAQCGLSTSESGDSSGPFVYLDDVIFTGGRAGNDLRAWIETEAPAKATVHIIVMATHRFGDYKLKEGLKKAAADAAKDIKFNFWPPLLVVENRRYNKNESEVLWPSSLPKHDMVDEYMAIFQRFPFEPRRPGVRRSPFSSELNRQLLEREMLLSGLRIRAACQTMADSLRPLGFGFFGLGFGATIVTYRNCPNNCPLALWWGDPDATSGALNWYPLLPRKGYGNSGITVVDIDFDGIL